MGTEALEAGFIGNNVLLQEPPYTLAYSNKRIDRRNRFLSHNEKRNSNSYPITSIKSPPDSPVDSPTEAKRFDAVRNSHGEVRSKELLLAAKNKARLSTIQTNNPRDKSSLYRSRQFDINR